MQPLSGPQHPQRHPLPEPLDHVVIGRVCCYLSLADILSFGETAWTVQQKIMNNHEIWGYQSKAAQAPRLAQTQREFLELHSPWLTWVLKMAPMKTHREWNITMNIVDSLGGRTVGITHRPSKPRVLVGQADTYLYAWSGVERHLFAIGRRSHFTWKSRPIQETGDLKRHLMGLEEGVTLCSHDGEDWLLLPDHAQKSIGLLSLNASGEPQERTAQPSAPYTRPRSPNAEYAISSANQEELIHFYTSLLGMKYDKESQQLDLFEKSIHFTEEGLTEGPLRLVTSRGLTELTDALAERGVLFQRAIDMVSRLTWVCFKDPAGNAVEVAAL